MACGRGCATSCAPVETWRSVLGGSSFFPGVARQFSDNASSSIVIFAGATTFTAKVTALSATTGLSLWSFTPLQRSGYWSYLSDSPSLTFVDATTVIATFSLSQSAYPYTYLSYTTEVYCLNTANGALRWLRTDLPISSISQERSHNLSSVSLPSLTSTGDFCFDAGNITALDAATGAIRFSVAVNMSQTNRRVGLDASRTLLIIAASDKSAAYFSAYSTVTGNATWTLSLAQPMRAPTLISSTLYAVLRNAALNSASIIGLEIADGTIVRNFDTASNEYLYVTDIIQAKGDLVLLRYGQLGTSVVKVSTLTGIEQWAWSFPSSSSSPLLTLMLSADGESVFVGTSCSVVGCNVQMWAINVVSGMAKFSNVFVAGTYSGQDYNGLIEPVAPDFSVFGVIARTRDGTYNPSINGNMYGSAGFSSSGAQAWISSFNYVGAAAPHLFFVSFSGQFISATLPAVCANEEKTPPIGIIVGATVAGLALVVGGSLIVFRRQVAAFTVNINSKITAMLAQRNVPESTALLSTPPPPAAHFFPLYKAS